MLENCKILGLNTRELPNSGSDLVRTCNGHVKPRSISNPTGAESRLTGACACKTTLQIKSNRSRIKTHWFMGMFNYAPNRIQPEQDQGSQVYVHVKPCSKSNPTGAQVHYMWNYAQDLIKPEQDQDSQVHYIWNQAQNPTWKGTGSKSNPTGAGLRLTSSCTCETTLQIHSNRRRNKSHRFM